MPLGPYTQLRRFTIDLIQSSKPEGDLARSGVWLFLAAMNGAIAMALELAAPRLYAPYFGNSIYVWGATISVTLASLAFGSAIGGWIADRTRSDVPIFLATLFSASYQFIFIFSAHFFVKHLPRLGEIAGTSAATLLIFSLPMAALASTTPMIIRLCSRPNNVGSIAGTVYSISTFGGIGGIFATIAWLIPHVGTQTTLKVLCGISFLIAAWGLAAHRRRLAFTVVPAVILFFIPNWTLFNGAVWTSESAYNLITVAKRRGQTLLLLNSANWIHTMWSASNPWNGFYQNYFALGPLLLPNASRLLILGLGGGASVHATRATNPSIDIDAIEIDPKVAEAAVTWFGLGRSDPKLAIHVADARPWLTTNSSTYDLVYVDVYSGGPQIPFHVITEEFFRTVRDHMSDDGALMINVLERHPDLPLIAPTAATLRQVFASVLVLPLPPDNYMLFAFAKKQPANEMRKRLRAAHVEGPIQKVVQVAEAGLRDFEPPPGTLVFTDDFAPIEEVTRRALQRPRAR